MEGNWSYYYENGQKEKESIYNNNKQIGQFIGWHDNGDIHEIGDMETRIRIKCCIKSKSKKGLRIISLFKNKR